MPCDLNGTLWLFSLEQLTCGRNLPAMKSSSNPWLETPTADLVLKVTSLGL
jgi:hypothetical protein